MCNLFAEPLLPVQKRDEREPSSIDPAGLLFVEYRDRCLWGPPDSTGFRRCLNARAAMEPFPDSVRQKANEFVNGEDPEYGAWERTLESGRSYLVGNTVSMRQFLRTHSSPLTGWQRMAYAWCLANPSLCLVLETRRQRRIYQVLKRGTYVEIGLPHQEYGGERHWISRDGITKVLVNVD